MLLAMPHSYNEPSLTVGLLPPIPQQDSDSRVDSNDLNYEHGKSRF